MEQPIAAQAAELGMALLWGVGLAAGYDVFRALRRSVGGRHLWDAVFCLLTLLSLWGFMLYPGAGRLRLLALAGMGLGALAWFLTLGRPVLFMMCKMLEIVKRIFALIFLPLKKTTEFLRKKAKKGKQGPRQLDRLLDQTLRQPLQR